MWKDFGGITINLNLDKDMPVISSSNLAFKKIDTRIYQYVSDTLPGENLEIVIDENWYQNILSTLRSPYLPMTLMMFLPFILIVLAVVIFIVWRLRKKKKQKS
ncbi:MAG: FeoB-associated Cys-rich membrane protein [Parabacteroides sp.]|nr:FeoB-associated Cys-rich membrane protein [Parabacteroides sp.]